MKKEEIIRETVKKTTNEEIVALNKQGKRTGVRAFLPVEEALALAKQRRQPPAARAAALMLHPDERVPLALLENYYLSRGQWAYADGLKEGLLWRAIKDARVEGVVWTPLLERCGPGTWHEKRMPKKFMRGLKPLADGTAAGKARTAKYERAKDPFLAELGEDEALDGKEEYRDSIKDKVQALPIADRVELACAKEKVLAELLTKLILPNEWTAPIAKRLATTKSSLISGILRDDNIPKSAKQGVFDYLVEALEKGRSLDSLAGNAAAELGWFRKTPLWEAALQFINTPGYSFRGSYLWRWMTEDLGKLSDKQWEELRPCFPIVAGWQKEHLLSASLNDPRIIFEDVEGILKVMRTRHIRLVIGRSKAINVPGVAEKLMKSEARNVARNVAQYAAPETYGRIFGKMVKKDPAMAQDSLQDRQKDVAEHVKRKDLVPLFSSEDRDRRIEAIKLAAKVGVKPKPGP